MMEQINHIIDSSFVDGPGNRTVIFFQGCNFRCQFCHNPETINKCNHCGLCVEPCPTGSLSIENNKVVWNEETCTDCGSCYKECPYYATPRVHNYTVDDVMDRIKKNRAFIRGITVSGGESSIRRNFVLELFKETKKLNLTTLMDTNGSYPLYRDEDLMKYTDGIMLDVKATNPFFHQVLTDAGNEQVLKNLVELAKINKLAEIRTVVFDGEDGSEQTVNDVFALIEPYIADAKFTYKLIKFRPIGVRGSTRKLRSPSDEKMTYLKSLLEEKGFNNVVIT